MQRYIRKGQMQTRSKRLTHVNLIQPMECDCAEIPAGEGGGRESNTIIKKNEHQFNPSFSSYNRTIIFTEGINTNKNTSENSNFNKIDREEKITSYCPQTKKKELLGTHIVQKRNHGLSQAFNTCFHTCPRGQCWRKASWKWLHCM